MESSVGTHMSGKSRLSGSNGKHEQCKTSGIDIKPTFVSTIFGNPKIMHTSPNNIYRATTTSDCDVNFLFYV